MPTLQDSFSSPSQDLINDLNAEKTPKPLSFGQQLVGINFNPSSDDKVGQAKSLFAQIADLVQDEMSKRETSPLSKVLQDHTIGEILNAQMNVVKLITLKY